MSSHEFYDSSLYSGRTWFDEGPEVSVKYYNAENTSSIGTTETDTYRQGVELTQQKHYDAGGIKIYAGEPGHVIRKNNFGEEKDGWHIDTNNTTFEETDALDPVTFLTTPRSNHKSISVDGNIYEHTKNGVISPFSIRVIPVIANSTNVELKDPAQFNASVVDGNTDTSNASCKITSVDYYDINAKNVVYFDVSLNERMEKQDKTRMIVFSDERYPRNVILSSSRGTDMDAALSTMCQITGSTDNYVSFKQRTGACGFEYENTLIGTDSIAFGGMTF